MKNYELKSSIASFIQEFIDYKRALGYKYDSEAYVMHQFDDYWKKTNGTNREITRDSLNGWMERRAKEGMTSRSARISVVRQFTIYMNGLGNASYIPMDKYIKDHPIIHVLSADEIQALFKAIDEYEPKRYPIFSIRMRAEYKVIFRLILTTGLRRSEACSIRVRDVDWDNNTIKIYNSKGNKDRLIYIAPDMMDLIKEYRAYLFEFVQRETEWLFPSFNIDEHISSGALAQRFKCYWKMTSYSESCEKDPTIHSLRHTYVVFCINLWLSHGKDVNLLLPYLSRQLGHKSPDETFYYYHQVLESFKTIQQKDSLSAAVIPEVRIR